MRTEHTPSSAQPRFPWIAAIAGAALVVVAAASLLRLPSAPLPRGDLTPAAPAVSLDLARGNAERGARLQEELELRDPAPLFLPSRWSSARAALPAGVLREPGTTVGVFPPKLVFGERGPEISFPAAAAVPADALTAVEAIERAPGFRQLSRRELQISPLRDRLARLVVSEAGGRGAPVIMEDLKPAGTDEETLLRRQLWSPIEALVAVTSAGLIGEPAVVSASGSEQVDDWAVAFLSGPARLGARLKPGFYRIVLGP